MSKPTLNKFIVCNHVVTGTWTQKVINGPHRAKCDGCGKVIKRSADMDVFKRRSLGYGSSGKTRALAAALSMLTIGGAR